MNWFQKLRRLKWGSGGTERPELPDNIIEKERDIPAGEVMAKQGTAVPPDVFPYILLACTQKHNNYIWNIPAPVVRIGSIKSAIGMIHCLRCTEGMIGGTVVHK